MAQGLCITACYRNGSDKEIGALYEPNKYYDVDHRDPFIWRHFKFDKDIDMPPEVRDALKLTKAEAENARGKPAPIKK